MSDDFIRGIRLRMYEDSDLQRVHDYSMQLLAENGMHMPSERALKIFRDHGFRVEGEQVYFTEDQVMKAVETAPSHYVINGLKNPSRKLDLGGGDYGVSTPIGPVSTMTIDEGTKPGTLEDMEKLLKIYQASDVINIVSNSGVAANDIDASWRHLAIMKALLKHTDKPLHTELFDYERMHQAIDMIEIVVGEKLQPGGNIYLSSGSCPSLSPMAFAADVLDNAIALAERGQVVTTGTATNAGVTGPIRLFGSLVMQNAEVLSEIVLAQLVNPGNPVGYGTGACPGNMRGATYCCGSPGRVALSLGFIEMGKRFYNLPTRSIPYSTDSLSPDYQCAMEAYEGTMNNILAGADYQLSEIGTVGGLMTTSFEKTILDEEMTSRLLSIRAGIDTSEDAASLESIMEVGSNGEFLTSDDTLDYMMDSWYPTVSDWDSKERNRPYNSYDYVLRRANAEWKKRLIEAPESVIDKATEEALDDYIAAHKK